VTAGTRLLRPDPSRRHPRKTGRRRISQDWVSLDIDRVLGEPAADEIALQAYQMGRPKVVQDDAALYAGAVGHVRASARASPTMPRPSRCVAALMAILLLATALRFLAVFTVGDREEVHGDEVQYLTAARSLVVQGTYPDAFRPPLYPAMLAVALAISDNLSSAREAQIILSVATIVLAFFIVRPRFGCTSALITASVIAFNPTLIHYTHFLWTDTLTAFFLTALVFLVERFESSQRAAQAFIAGVVLGLAALSREALVYVLPGLLACIYFAQEAPRQWKAPLVALAGAVIVIAPWTIRNSVSEREFVLISTARWAPIAEGLLHDPITGRRSTAITKRFRQELRRQPGHLEKEAFARRIAVDSLRHANLYWLLSKAWAGPSQLFSAENQTARFARHDWFSPRYRCILPPLVSTEVIYYIVTTLFGLVALWFVPGGWPKAFVVSTILLHVAMHMVAYSTHRYRVPILPLLVLYIGPLLSGHAVSGQRWRDIGATVTGLAFLVAVGSTALKPGVRRFFIQTFDGCAIGGRGAAMSRPPSTRLFQAAQRVS